jgi:hypothetical protein
MNRHRGWPFWSNASKNWKGSWLRTVKIATAHRPATAFIVPLAPRVFGNDPAGRPAVRRDTRERRFNGCRIPTASFGIPCDGVVGVGTP